jgi:hypothetical protein
MSPLKQIDDSSPSDARPIAIAMLAEGWESLSVRLGINFAEYDLGSLGKTKRAAFAVESGKHILLESSPASSLDRNTTTIALLEEEIDENSYTQILEEILIETVLSSADLTWKHDAISFQPHEVWRQDDQGNRFLVKQTDCKADALRLAGMFEARGHKQTYWIQPK